MLELVMRNYWWPGISKYVLNYVDGCDVCQRGKAFPEMLAGKLMPNPIPNVPWTDISVDFITGLPEAQGYNAILVICDRFTKQVHIIPTTKETNSLGLACLYQDHMLHPTQGTLRNSTGSETSDPLGSSDQYIIVSSFILSHLIFSFMLLFSLLHTCAPLYPSDLSRTSGTLPCILLVYRP